MSYKKMQNMLFDDIKILIQKTKHKKITNQNSTVDK